MKVSEIRALSPDEIASRLDAARDGYRKLRFQAALGQLKDLSQLRLARRNIARLETVLRERSKEPEGRQE
ncbi:MAG TPA: 50S ribosomal protein L29 [Anaerolineales bacterium]|uniref:Large ribosomal subunit protein uL29 n=2 Tax=environmental samples TaxID=58229 RepID=A0A0H4T8L6_9CHLR|nr:50S ribosomal protein L29, large subunit ribosomal protein L29 [uncultured Chloroflexi bacterium Rifle_16ft_4_minimus_450]AKQ05151.1 50S ribosomal protein L29, large subunit ribosomal protein L29 [uncultured Chloroflexi bacterium Rifle_16ft_4_minimus_26684]HLB63552.1 50S ribosomal protein L29 [Anaerolineales bacterium]